MLEHPVDLLKQLRMENMKYYSELYQGNTYFDSENGELVALTYIPPHARTWYDRKQLKSTSIQVRNERHDLFEKGREKELWEYVEPLIKPYRKFKVHFPPAESAEVLMSINFNGSWDKLESPANIAKYGSPVEFFSSFYNS